MGRLDEVAEAEQLFRDYLHHGRVFVGERQRDGSYDVKIRSVEHLRNPIFRFACEFWGVERAAVERQVEAYNDQLILNRPCHVAQEMVNALIEAANDKRVEAVRRLATFLRGNGAASAADIGWLIWRLQKVAEWGDHAGLEKILDDMTDAVTEDTPESDLFNDVIINATGRSLTVWVASALREAAVALQPA